MKLIFCPLCEDVFKLHTTLKLCNCKKSGGFYHSDGLNATVYGQAIPLGFSNPSFAAAIMNLKNPNNLDSLNFGAFMIPEPCRTITRMAIFDLEHLSE